jgi:hypothetical protein
MRRVLEVAPCTQVGIRSLSTEEAAAAASLPTRIFYDVSMRSEPDWIGRIVESLAARNPAHHVCGCRRPGRVGPALHLDPLCVSAYKLLQLADHGLTLFVAASQKRQIEGPLGQVNVAGRHEWHFDGGQEACRELLHFSLRVKGPVNRRSMSDGEYLAVSVLEFQFLLFGRQLDPFEPGIGENSTSGRGANESSLKEGKPGEFLRVLGASAGRCSVHECHGDEPVLAVPAPPNGQFASPIEDWSNHSRRR